MKQAAPQPLERDTQSACMDWLNTLPGLRVWRQNTGAQVIPATGTAGRRFLRFGQKGQADLTGILRPSGVRIELEVKRVGNKPTLEQAAWLSDMRDSGAIAFWFDSLDSCVDQMRFEFKRRGWLWRESWQP